MLSLCSGHWTSDCELQALAWLQLFSYRGKKLGKSAGFHLKSTGLVRYNIIAPTKHLSFSREYNH